MLRNLLFLLMTLSFSSFLFAADENTPSEEDIKSHISRMIKTITMGKAPDRIQPSEVAGLYEVYIGARIFYVSENGQYLVQGNIMNMETLQDITEPRLAQARADVLVKLDENSMIVYAPENTKTEHTITVFTDVDCVFCRRLHQEVGQLNEMGIKVRYLLSPRSKKNQPPYQKAVTAWCSENRAETLTKLKRGLSVEPKECDHPIDQQLLIARDMGINAMPGIVLEDGRVILGYRPAAVLKSMLEEEKLDQLQ